MVLTKMKLENQTGKERKDVKLDNKAEYIQ
jgi:hypothetical protein